MTDSVMELKKPETNGPLLETLKSGISGDNMMSTLARLARFTKLAGTPSERESLDDLRSKLAGMGFRVSVILHDAYISLPGKAELDIGQEKYRCITHSMAQPTGPAGLKAELVDIGAGKAAQLAGRDLQGKIVIVDGIATPGVALRMSGLGVAGIIHVSPHEHLHEMCISPVWGNPSPSTMKNLPSCAVITVSEEDGAKIRARLADAGAVEAHSALIHAEIDTGWRKTPILVADMDAPGANDTSPFVLFSGHHDTWYYGVMDNGSANATMIEVARLVAENRQRWQRSLRICFWSGHSQGRYSGSAWYADQNWSELNDRCLAHVNIDSPGGIGAENLRNTGVMSALRPLAAQAIASETGQQLAGKPKVRSADESLQSLGIPSMFGSLSGQVLSEDSKMRNALGWWWHTPHDLLDKIDEANLVRDAKVVLECLWRLLTDPVLPIDIRAPLAELHEQLTGLETKLADKIDLSPLLARVEALTDFFTKAPHHLEAQIMNEAIRQACREIVLLEHTHGDRFIHEPAINQPAWPVLDPLRILADTVHDTDDFQFAYVDAVRARNRIAWHLDRMGPHARQVLRPGQE